MKKIQLVTFTLALLIALAPTGALAKSSYLQAFKKQYPNYTGASCNICHTQPPKLNYYGQDYQKANHDFVAIEQLDSTGDGKKNIDKIKANINPGVKN